MTRQELKKYRTDLKLTQSDFADRIGLTLRGYQKLEYGISRIKKIHENAVNWVIHQRQTKKIASFDEGQP